MRRIFVLTLVLLVLFAMPAGAKSKATKACTEALDTAEALRIDLTVLDSIRTDFQNATTTALTTTTNFATALNGVTAAIRDQNPKVASVTLVLADRQAKYEAAAKKCRAGK